jgi:hypothetical protein
MEELTMSDDLNTRREGRINVQLRLAGEMAEVAI